MAKAIDHRQNARQTGKQTGKQTDHRQSQRDNSAFGIRPPAFPDPFIETSQLIAVLLEHMQCPFGRHSHLTQQEHDQYPL